MHPSAAFTHAHHPLVYTCFSIYCLISLEMYLSEHVHHEITCVCVQCVRHNGYCAAQLYCEAVLERACTPSETIQHCCNVVAVLDRADKSLLARRFLGNRHWSCASPTQYRLFSSPLGTGCALCVQCIFAPHDRYIPNGKACVTLHEKHIQTLLYGRAVGASACTPHSVSGLCSKLYNWIMCNTQHAAEEAWARAAQDRQETSSWG